MKTFNRILNLRQLLEKKSHFLLGPRATGKSFLIRRQLSDEAVTINLLRSDYYLRLSADPMYLESIIAAAIDENPKLKWIAIDEVQRIPELLNEVHRLIEEKQYRFLLTGSSARKLKRGQSNLLAGRAWQSELFPLVSPELPDIDLDRYLRYGGLPAIYPSENPEEELQAYISTYLMEEIQAESLIRNLAPFSRFLSAAAQTNGAVLNFTKFGNDAQLSPSTVREYFFLLEDTLIGFLVPAWTKSKKRKAITTAKFYFFDTGVTHALSGTQVLERHSNLYGNSFEQWIAIEIRAAISYLKANTKLSFWRSLHHQEVDFVIGDSVGIEVKASQHTTNRDAKGLHVLREEGILHSFFLVSQDPINRIEDGVHFMHWRDWLKKLWTGELF